MNPEFWKKGLEAAQSLDALQAAVTLANGAILIDDYDTVIFDDVLREFPMWERIDKRLAPGDVTGGFDQTAVGNARSADPRSLGYTAASPTRAQRTARSIKAIVRNLEFGMFDVSVYQQQGRRFGNLEGKDVDDMVTSAMRKWQTEAYEGSVSGDATEFDGLRTLLSSGALSISAAQSVVDRLDSIIVDMMNTSTRGVRPTAVYCNAKVVQFISREYIKSGEKLPMLPMMIGGNVMQVPYLPTAAGNLPLIVDPFNASVSGTPTTYPTFIVTENLLSWQYVMPLGMPGPEPKTFQIAPTNQIVQQYTTVMFGALEILGAANHHKRVNVEHRDTPVAIAA